MPQQFTIPGLYKALVGLKPNHYNGATATIGAPVQTVGTGLSDLTAGGTSTALVDHVYTIKISVTGAPDSFQWKTDSGSFSGNVAITGAAQTLANGVTVTFAATTGHTLNDTWTITVLSGVSISAAVGLGRIIVNQVGSGAELKLYDGNSSSGTLLYDGVTAAWTAGNAYEMGLALQGGQGLYVALYASTTYPDLIVGTY